MSQALSRKWRPGRFEDVVGQTHITQTLRNSVAADRVGHAYLFCGPRGTGKTTNARLIAKAVNCLHDDPAQRPCNSCATCISVNNGRFLDLIEIDAASNTGVDDIRDLRDKINFAPSQGRFKVYIIDEVHMLSTAAFNALLKTLEEPPAHAIFVLATTEEHKVPMTIKSRCQQFNFRLFNHAEISGRLRWLADQEGITVEPAAISLIATQGAGSIRDAESLLDQLVTTPGDTITLERAQMVLGTATNASVINLIDAWLNKEGATGLHIIQDALASGTDPRQFCRQLVAYLRQLLLLQAAGADLPLDTTAEEKATMLAQAQRAPRQGLIDALKGYSEAALTPASSWQPQLPLELAFIEQLPATAAPPLPATPPPKTEAAPQTETAVLPHHPPEPNFSPHFEEATTPADSSASDETTVITPPSPPKSPKQAPDPSKGTPTIGLDQIKQQWPEMVKRVGNHNKNLPPLLAMSKPLGTESNTIILGFDYPIFKEKFNNTKDGVALLATTFSELLGLTCQVRCVVTSEYNVSISKADFQALADELGGVVRQQ